MLAYSIHTSSTSESEHSEKTSTSSSSPLVISYHSDCTAHDPLITETAADTAASLHRSHGSTFSPLSDFFSAHSSQCGKVTCNVVSKRTITLLLIVIPPILKIVITQEGIQDRKSTRLNSS